MMKKHIISISILLLLCFSLKSEEVYFPIDLRIERSNIIVIAKFKGFKWGEEFFMGVPSEKKHVFEEDKTNAKKVTIIFEPIEYLKGKSSKKVIAKTYTHTYDGKFRSTGFSPEILEKDQIYICFLVKNKNPLELPVNSNQYIEKLTDSFIHRQVGAENKIVEMKWTKDEYINYIKENKNKKSKKLNPQNSLQSVNAVLQCCCVQ